MDVVADAGAVGSRVIGAMYLQIRSVRGGGQCEWNQMSFGIVKFSNLAAGIGSGGVEIAQADGAHSIGAVVGFERVFEKEFGGAVRVHRLARSFFGDGNPTGNAIDCATGGEDEAADTGVQCAVQEFERSENIVAEIFARVVD